MGAGRISQCANKSRTIDLMVASLVPRRDVSDPKKRGFGRLVLAMGSAALADNRQQLELLESEPKMLDRMTDAIDFHGKALHLASHWQWLPSCFFRY